MWKPCGRRDSRRPRSSRRPSSPPTSTTPIAWQRAWASSQSAERSLRAPAARRYTVVRPPGRDGGTGRREGLKNLWAQAREGSTPSPGTIRIRYLLNRLSSLRMFPVQNCARNVLTRFWERDDRARGEALDLMETRQLLATGDKISLRDDGIAAVDRLRLVPDHRDQTESMVVGGWNPDPRGS